MHELDIQIREYIDATSDPLTVDEILYAPVGDAPVRPTAKHQAGEHLKRGWFVAGVAAVAVLIAIGSVALLASTRPTDAPAEVPPIPQPIETDSVPTSTLPRVVESEPVPTSTLVTVVETVADRTGPPFRVVDFDRLEWTRVDSIPSEDLLLFRDIDGYVLTGSEGLKYSDDGRTWTTDVLSPELAEYSGFMSRGGWAVTGSPLSRRTASDSRDLLRSDGSQWNRVNLPGSEPAWPDLPIESGNVVLVPDDRGDFGFWVSIDDGPFVFREAPWDWPQDTIDPTGRATFLAAPDGGFIAVTTVHDVHPNDRNLADGDRDNATLMWAQVWTSPDGITWQNQGLPGFLADDVIGRTVSFNIRAAIETLEVSVFNSSAFNRPIGATGVGVSVSTDGVDWSPVRDPEFPFGADCWIFTTNMGYLCAGMTVEPETAFELSLSTDGVEWATIEPPEIDFESYGFVGAASHGGVGDLLFVSFGDMWIGHFEE